MKTSIVSFLKSSTSTSTSLFKFKLRQIHNMRVVTVPLNEDNYGYLLIDQRSNNAAIVDVSSQPQKMLEVVAREGVNLVKVLTTHKHWDHAGGNNEIKKIHPDIEIVGSVIDNVEACTKFVEDGEEFMLSDIKIKCLLTNGHTNGHISYHATAPDNESIVFTGDCLFIGGCGRFFEGSNVDMLNSMKKIEALGDATKIYCGHEYTTNNYKWISSIDKSNIKLNEMIILVNQQREQGLPSIPSTVGREKLTNPFMRYNDPAMNDLCKGCNSDPAAIIQYLRNSKNKFK